MNSLITNVTKVKKRERKITSACRKETIQFGNKWKSTDLKTTVKSKVACTEELSEFLSLSLLLLVVFFLLLLLLLLLLLQSN